MKFSNPIQTKTAGVSPAPSYVTESPLATAVQGISDVMKVASKSPSQSAVSEGMKTQGHQLAIQRASQWQYLADTKGRDEANRWRERTSLRDQAEMSATEAEQYRTTWKAQAGGSPVADREQLARDIQAQQIKAEAENRQNMLQLGRQIATADGDPSTDPSQLGEEDLIKLGNAWESRRKLDEYRNERNKTFLSDRAMNSTSAYQGFATTLDTQLSSRLLKYQKSLAKGDGSNIEMKGQLIADLTQFRSNIIGELTNAVQSNGGSLSDVSPSDITKLENMVDNQIAFVRGDYITEVNESHLNGIMSGLTVDFMQLPTNKRAVTQMGVSKYGGVNMNVNIAQADLNTVAPNPDLERQMYLRAQDGMAQASVNLQYPNEQLSIPYRDAGKVMGAMKINSNPELKTSSAEMLFNNLNEAVFGTRSVRRAANGKNGQVHMLDQAMRMERGAIAPEFITAAENEGVDPTELWRNKARTFVQETLIPSMRVQDTDFFSSVRVQDNGGKITLSVDEGNIQAQAPRSWGRQDLSQGVESARLRDRVQRLRKVEREMNKLIGQYSHIMDADPSDVSTAIAELLTTSVGMSTPEQTQARVEQLGGSGGAESY